MGDGYGTNQALNCPSLGQIFKSQRLFAKVDDAFPGKTRCYSSTSGFLAPTIQEACAMGVDEVGSKGYSAKRSKLSKVVHCCCKCNMPLCTKHM